MIGRSSSFLGVAVSDHSIACAEVSVTGNDRRAVRRTAVFVFPPDASLDSPDAAGLALASAAKRADADGGVLVLGRGGGEIVWRQGGAPKMLRHVPVIMNGSPDTADVAPLGAELRRAVATAQQQNGAASGRPLLLLDGLGLAKHDVADLSARAGVEVRAADGLEMLGIANADSEGGKPAGGLAPAMSLAL